MTVYYTGGGGGGFLGTLGKIVGLGANFIPGMQPFAPFLNAGLSLANGDPAGAVMSMIMGPVKDAMGNARATKAANQDSLRYTLDKIAGEDIDGAPHRDFFDNGAIQPYQGAPRLTDTPARYRRFINNWRR